MMIILREQDLHIYVKKATLEENLVEKTCVCFRSLKHVFIEPSTKP